MENNYVSIEQSTPPTVSQPLSETTVQSEVENSTQDHHIVEEPTPIIPSQSLPDTSTPSPNLKNSAEQQQTVQEPGLVDLTRNVDKIEHSQLKPPLVNKDGRRTIDVQPHPSIYPTPKPYTLPDIVDSFNLIEGPPLPTLDNKLLQPDTSATEQAMKLLNETIGRHHASQQQRITEPASVNPSKTLTLPTTKQSSENIISGSSSQQQNSTQQHPVADKPLFEEFFGAIIPFALVMIFVLRYLFREKINIPDTNREKVVSKAPQAKSERQFSISPPLSVRNVVPKTHISAQPFSTQVDELETEYIRQQVKLLEPAIHNNQKVQFIYETNNGGNIERTVTPTGFKIVEQTVCLQGYCHLRQADRTFAIKRMKGVKIVSNNETNHQLQSPVQSVAAKTSPTDTELQNRPYIKCHFDELEKITNSHWNNLKVLSEIHHELEFRSRKKAHALRERISQRLTQLEGKNFTWPTTEATKGSQNLSSEVFKYGEGLLRQCGYKVGVSGLPEHQRRQILDSIFLRPLPFIDDAIYLNEWGEPNTDKRLKKIAESIAAFTRNAKRRNTSSLNKAIQDWESDLAYLKRSYYDGRFYFHWPRTGSSDS